MTEPGNPPSVGRGLADVSEADLETLGRALRSGRMDRLSARALQSLGLGHVDAVATLGEGLSGEAALRLIELLLADRRYRPAPQVELVWTGPEAGLRPTRDTAVVLQELFRKARRQVIVAGYAFDHGREILAPLHEAMAERGVEVHMFLNVERAPRHKMPEEHVRDAGIKFLAANWPEAPPRPVLYAWPDTVAAGAVASLHAKCVVVDRRYTLIGSANFTDRGLHRNIETGIVLDHALTAERLAEQWLSLASRGFMQRLD